jgi:hypothetical protein
MSHDKKTTLFAYWSKKENDILYCYPKSPSDGHLLHQYFGAPGLLRGGKDILYGGRDLVKDLGERGYDIKTIKFSVKLKETQGEDKPESGNSERSQSSKDPR